MARTKARATQKCTQTSESEKAVRLRNLGRDEYRRNEGSEYYPREPGGILCLSAEDEN